MIGEFKDIFEFKVAYHESECLYFVKYGLWRDSLLAQFIGITFESLVELWKENGAIFRKTISRGFFENKEDAQKFIDNVLIPIMTINKLKNNA